MDVQTANTREFLFLIGSARTGGNTEVLARKAAEVLPSSVNQNWLSLIEHPLPLFEDIRHEDGLEYRIQTEHERTILDATLAATDIVIASPVYWYSVSAGVKLYLDHWSGWMRLDDIEFKKRMAGKTMWCVTVLSDEDFSAATPLIETLRMSAEYMKMTFAGTLIGYGSRPGDVLNDADSLDRAKRFFPSIFD
jgi:multimeric flavodoxin WrbA